MATIGESSSASHNTCSDKPVIVRVKRKSSQSPLDAFWLKINERPSKRKLLDFEKLSISDDVKVEESKTKKVFVQHVETVNDSKAPIDVVQSFMPNSDDVSNGLKHEERKLTFKRDSKQEELLSKARQNQEVSAKNARFEQMWRSRMGKREPLHDKELHDMCHFYDVVRIDGEERTSEVQVQEPLSIEDQGLLCSYLPLLRELIPSAAEEIESDVQAYMSKQDDYVYDYYAVKDDMDIGDEDIFRPFPLVQVEDEDSYDGPDDNSEYESDDSNAEAHPRNDYPDETSEEENELESEVSTSELEKEESDGSSSKSEEIEDSRQELEHADPSYEDDFYDDFMDGDNFDYDYDDGGNED